MDTGLWSLNIVTVAQTAQAVSGLLTHIIHSFDQQAFLKYLLCKKIETVLGTEDKKHHNLCLAILEFSF